MKEALAKALIELLKVKSIITIMIISVSCVLAISGKIDQNTFMTSIVVPVVIFYFAKNNDKNGGDQK